MRIYGDRATRAAWVWVLLGLGVAWAQPGPPFAAGVDSSGWAQAISNQAGQIMIESPEYPRGLWLQLLNGQGVLQAGIEVGYQGAPDSLVTLRCTDPTGLLQETLVWSHPWGDTLYAVLQNRQNNSAPEGLTPVDWRIDLHTRSRLQPLAAARLADWDQVASFVHTHWHQQQDWVAVRFDSSTALIAAVDQPAIVDTLMVHLQQIHRQKSTSLDENTVFSVELFKGGLLLHSLSLFADPDLEHAIRNALGRPRGFISQEAFASLSSLDLSQIESVDDLAGIERLSAVQILFLGANPVGDLAPLAQLDSLQLLSMWNNQIDDLSPLAKLSNLQGLYSWGNPITDLSPLSQLDKLQRLLLAQTQIADLTPLTRLHNLQELSLAGNQVADLAPLSRLDRLVRLELASNQLADLTPLASLDSLQSLALQSNQLTDLTPLAGLAELRDLSIPDGQIADLSPLAGLINLQELNLPRNQIEDIAPLLDNTGFSGEGFIDLSGNPLSAQAIDEHIPALQARGIEVAY
ncbi:MAG: hypothetical protein GKR89_03235 [Candidatus Latescibacteria bacterium]|nr:hypothetical protein [Candidatus Latescibacterota bacterium]